MSQQPLGSDRDEPGFPPWYFWLVPLAVAALRAVPFLLTRVVSPQPGMTLVPVGYNPLDAYAYAGFIRQAAETGDWLLFNPHTILPQDGRYFLPLFSLLGYVCRWTGADPFWVLELSRVPLIFAFFAALWWFLQPLIPNMRRRMIASCLVGFSGGLELLLLATLNYWPTSSRNVVLEALSDDHGWSTFAALNNPLWVAGLTLTLVALRPLMQSGGPTRGRDWVQFVAGFVATYFVHPYSGLVVLGVTVGLLVARWAFPVPGGRGMHLKKGGAALALGLGIVGAVALWQNQDPVFRLTAGRVLGDHQLSVFWYPVTLGALGLLAVQGWRRWLRAEVPHRLEIGVWTVTVMWMHASPLFNGFHFVFHLHLPLCIVAATAMDEWLTRFNEARWRTQLATALVLAATFQSAAAVTWRSARTALGHQFPNDAMAAIERLGQEPAGKVYTAPFLGTLIPAYTSHRVYSGHWFLTPGHPAKQKNFTDLIEGRAEPEELVGLLQREPIDYVLLPPVTPREVVEAVRPLANSEVQIHGFMLFYLHR
jgi:hypothetical protein